MSILAPESDRPDRPLDGVGVQLHPAILQEQHQPRPVAQGVADRLGEGGAPGDPLQLGREPGLQGLDDRSATLLPGRAPYLGRVTADLGFDRVELADPAQRLFGQRRAGGPVELVEAPPAMGPTEGELDLVRWATRQQALEASIAVHLQDTLELGQVGGRMLTLAVLGVEVDHRRRGAALPGPIIDGVAPQAPGLGPAPARVEHRQARVVGEDPGRAHDVPTQQAPQRLEPPAGPAHPAAQGRAVELDTLAREDLRLAVQREDLRLAVERQASGAGESHPRALPEPYVNLSAHTAPSVRPLAYRSFQCAKSPGEVLITRASQSRALFGRCRRDLNLRRAHVIRWKSIRRRLASSADL